MPVANDLPEDISDGRMRTMRASGVLFFGMLVHVSLFAQTVQFLVVSKSHTSTQTDNSTTVDTANPFSFEAHVEGSGDLSGGAVTLTKPSGSGSTTMTYNSGGQKWGLNASFADKTSLDAAYGNGNYSLTAYGQTVTPISVTGDIYPSVAPLATNLSGGTIVGGVLTWDVSQSLTITVNGTADHIGINISGQSYNVNPETFGGTTLSALINPGQMVAGNTYLVELDFDNIVGGTLGNYSGTGAMLSPQYAGVYNRSTTFTINAVSAIPEPATYAAIFGALALAGVMIHRRRQAA
jgi:hypothetical protein